MNKKAKDMFLPTYLFCLGSLFFYWSFMSFHLGRIYPVNEYVLTNKLGMITRTSNPSSFYITVAVFIFLCSTFWGGFIYSIWVSIKSKGNKKL